MRSRYMAILIRDNKNSPHFFLRSNTNEPKDSIASLKVTSGFHNLLSFNIVSESSLSSRHSTYPVVNNLIEMRRTKLHCIKFVDLQ